MTTPAFNVPEVQSFSKHSVHLHPSNSAEDNGSLATLHYIHSKTQLVIKHLKNHYEYSLLSYSIQVRNLYGFRTRE